MRRITSTLPSAIRGLARAPLYSFAVVSMLAAAFAGIGLTFAAVDSVALRPMPVSDPGRLVEVYALTSQECAPGCLNVFALPAFTALRKQSRSLSQSAAFAEAEYRSGDAETKEVVSVAAVSGDFYNVLGVHPVLGRFLTQSDDVDGAVPTAILSYTYWKSRYGGDRAVLRKTIALGDAQFSVVGVAPPGFDYPGGKSAWITLAANRVLSHGAGQTVRGVARLALGGSVVGADAEWRLLTERFAQDDTTQLTQSSTVRPFPGAVGEIGSRLATLIAAALTITVLAVTSVLGLVLLRILRRRREFTIRAALGADRSAVVAMALGEVSILVVSAGACSIVLIRGSLLALQRLLGRAFPELFDLAMDVRVSFALVVVIVAVGSVLVAGYLWAGNRIDARSASSGESASAYVEARGRGIRGQIVSVQVALVIVLCAITLSMSQLLHRAGHIDLGYETDRLVVGSLDLPEESYREPDRLRGVFPAIAERLSTLTGGQNSAVWRLSSSGVFGKLTEGTVTLEGGRELESFLQCNSTACSAPESSTDVMPGYFEALGVPIVRGRGFRASDNQGASPVAIVNERAAREWWPAGDPIGKHLRLGGSSSKSPWLTVVGVARQQYAVSQMALRLSMAGAKGYPLLFRPLLQTEIASRQGYLHWFWERKIWIGVRSKAKGVTAAEVAIRRTASELLPGAGLENVGPLRDALISSDATKEIQGSAFLSWIVGGLSLLIALVGLNAALTEDVRRSARDLALRMALGASPGRVMREVFGRGLMVLAWGTGTGLLACIVLNRFVHNLFWTWNGYVRGELFSVGLSKESLVTPSIVLPLVVALILSGILATLLPARWAASRNPGALLREQ